MKEIKIKIIIDKDKYEKGIKRFGRNTFLKYLGLEAGLNLNGHGLKDLEEYWGNINK